MLSIIWELTMKYFTIYILFFSVLLAGCDPVKTRTAVPNSKYTVEENHSCHKTGYCYKCGYYNGKSSCGFHFSSSCSGKRLSLFEKEQFAITTESGKSFIRTESKLIKHINSCH